MNLKWDYLEGERRHGSQFDWNQTIVTKLNELTSFKASVVSVPVKFKSIFETLFYYNEKSQILSSKYKIEYTELNSNILTTNDGTLEIINYEINKDLSIDGHVDTVILDNLDEK